jgi:hypothetical protein
MADDDGPEQDGDEVLRYGELRRPEPLEPELELELEPEPISVRGLLEEIVLVWIADAHQHHRAAQSTLTRAVRAARRLGLTWEEIGRTMGISKQTASKRFGPRVRADEDPTLF